MRRYIVAFVMSHAVSVWAVRVIVGYVTDEVMSYAGSTPMALDTAICLLILGVAGILISSARIRPHD